jgi:uncharacterized membrane protein
MEIFQFTAVLSCTLFTGVAIYINLAEHPVHVECDTETEARSLRVQWARRRAVQSGLGFSGFRDMPFIERVAGIFGR